MKFKTQITYILLVSILASMLSGCKAGGERTGVDYMPDMRYSKAYEYYVPSPTIDGTEDGKPYFKNGQVSQLPVKGTVPRGMLTTDLTDADDKAAMPHLYFTASEADYERAKTELINPITLTSLNADRILAEGKSVYETHCLVCHGAEGKGKGHLVNIGKISGVPNYVAVMPALTDGAIFHTLSYGKGNMGAYGSQINPEERWKVIHYIKSMLNDPVILQVEAPEVIEEEIEEEEDNHHGHGGDHDNHSGNHGDDDGHHDNTHKEDHSDNDHSDGH